MNEDSGEINIDKVFVSVIMVSMIVTLLLIFIVVHDAPIVEERDRDILKNYVISTTPGMTGVEKYTLAEKVCTEGYKIDTYKQ